jgi:hypothetical protein
VEEAKTGKVKSDEAKGLVVKGGDVKSDQAKCHKIKCDEVTSYVDEFFASRKGNDVKGGC